MNNEFYPRIVVRDFNDKSLLILALLRYSREEDQKAYQEYKNGGADYLTSPGHSIANKMLRLAQDLGDVLTIQEENEKQAREIEHEHLSDHVCYCFCDKCADESSGTCICKECVCQGRGSLTKHDLSEMDDEQL